MEVHLASLVIVHPTPGAGCLLVRMQDGHEPLFAAPTPILGTLYIERSKIYRAIFRLAMRYSTRYNAVGCEFA
ncbi:hypothetical protein [Paenibacillus segetis]|uniref:hypothetical protein n=1 Tax=Paenibacillus segetis TaxID=1325360 RepID=UPI0018889568|nr:hypothetical protein [Paenibacillus segetis]